MWDTDNIEVHYIALNDVSIQWLPSSYYTVQEYNFWEGPSEKGTGVRCTVLMETNHEAVLKISNLLTAGDSGALEALLLVHNADPKAFYVLGYDFQLDCPRVIINLK